MQTQPNEERPDEAPEMRTCPTCQSRIPADEECGCDELPLCGFCGESFPRGFGLYCTRNCWLAAGEAEAA